MQSRESRLILIVEDSDDDYNVTIRAFKKNNLANPVRRCDSGSQALDYLNQRGEFSASVAPRPDLILLDLNLPGTDGREVLCKIKSDPKLRQIPVIVLTTSLAEQDIVQSYDNGANSFLKKAMDLESFVNTIGHFKNYWVESSELPTKSL